MSVLKAFRKELLNFRLAVVDWRSPPFECPVCHYTGRFCSVFPPSGLRRYARCPKCGALERHRLQFLVTDGLLKQLPSASLTMLHIAPETFFADYFKQRVHRYETADLLMNGVDYNVDLTELPFPDESYDFVFASHVLEHIKDDMAALAEIRRILKPGGIAVLPVPLVSRETVEYPEPNPAEAYHVRAPGYDDYFNRYSMFFKRVEVVTSEQFPEKYQLYVYEDRSKFPTSDCPMRPSMHGRRHSDAVPVCYV